MSLLDGITLQPTTSYTFVQANNAAFQTLLIADSVQETLRISATDYITPMPTINPKNPNFNFSETQIRGYTNDGPRAVPVFEIGNAIRTKQEGFQRAFSQIAIGENLDGVSGSLAFFSSSVPQDRLHSPLKIQHQRSGGPSGFLRLSRSSRLASHLEPQDV